MAPRQAMRKVGPLNIVRPRWPYKLAVNPVLNSNADINFSYGFNLTIWSSGVESEEAVSAVSPSRPDPVPGSPPRAVGAQSVPALCFSRYPGVYLIPSRSAGTLRALHSGRGRLRSFRATLGSLQTPLYFLPGRSHFRLARDTAVGGAAADWAPGRGWHAAATPRSGFPLWACCAPSGRPRERGAHALQPTPASQGGSWKSWILEVKVEWP